MAAGLTAALQGRLPAPTAARLAALAGRPWSADFYLAGSAALALHLDHRPVRDLDLMGGTRRLQPPERRDLLADLLALDPATRVETARDGYLFIRFPDEVALRLFWYPYPLVDPLEERDGLAVASLVDLGLMKLGALISRGTRRDFVDLHLIARRLPLDELLERAGEKFGHVGDFAVQATKALADFSEADEEPLPALAEPLAWQAVRDWARGEAARLGAALLAG
ncbi:MAG: nucleotidyl transferase AbiEii/AbiGii toxin family protein [Thermoanaerobaculia bacterium]|nr:MAG: nucleotidyl transferase AbiEii/AbiGii toxin family protein [Thermoanaerobaculia bacterium]